MSLEDLFDTEFMVEDPKKGVGCKKERSWVATKIVEGEKEWECRSVRKNFDGFTRYPEQGILLNSRVQMRCISNIVAMNLLIKLYHIAQQLRWYQWYKAFYTFFALLWIPHSAYTAVSLVFVAAVIFIIASSIVYIINDIYDIERDSLHPTKKQRPLAAGKITLFEAYSLLLILSGTLLLAMGAVNNTWLAVIILVYLFVNILYTFGLKHLPYIDIITIGMLAGLRVIAGFVVLGLPVAWYFVMVIVTLVLFVMSVQRLAEISMNLVGTRPVLRVYNPKVLKLLMTVFMMISVILYYFAMAMVAIPLVYTDVLYFLVLFSVHQFMMFSHTKVNKIDNGFKIFVENRTTLVLSLLFALVMIVSLVWFLR